jgi:hypothetical protein
MKYRGPKKGNLQNGFILALVCSVGLAFLFPSPGAKGGWIHPDLLNKDQGREGCLEHWRSG